MPDDRQAASGSDETELRSGDGIRTDNAGSGVGVSGPAPGGDDPDRAERLADSPAGNVEPLGGLGTSAGGGHGTGSDKQSSGGTGEGDTNAGDDAETEWLREAPGGSASRP
jgi:hypothetical protein